MQWIPTGTGHELAIRDGAIVARNSKGKELASVPPAARKTAAWEDLDAALSFLHTHDAEAGAEVERWLLRSLPVPRAVLAEVWPDEAWRSWLTDLVVAADDGKVAGFLRAADPGGLGVVDLDGESVTITAERVLLPHPALLADLDDLREFAVELGIKQRFDQLFREVHRRPADIAPEVVELTQYAGVATPPACASRMANRSRPGTGSGRIPRSTKRSRGTCTGCATTTPCPSPRSARWPTRRGCAWRRTSSLAAR